MATAPLGRDTGKKKHPDFAYFKRAELFINLVGRWLRKFMVKEYTITTINKRGVTDYCLSKARWK